MPTLFVSYTGLLGGAERILLDHAPAVDARACIACPEGLLAEHARAEGLRVFPLRERSIELRASARDRLATPVRLAAHAREVRALVESLRPEVVYGWGMRAGMACAAALAEIRPRPAFVLQHNDLLPGPLIATVVRAAARRADRVACLSESIARDLDPGGELEERMRVIRAGVDLSRFEPAPAPEGPPTALFLAAMLGWKRPELALEITALAARELPELRLTVAGPVIDGRGRRLEALLRERAERPDLAGRVAFAGALLDPREALRSASCLLHCASQEPYGMALVEALASARPVVAPASAGPTEIVVESCGRLYAPGDVSAGAAALVDVLAVPARCRDMGAAGRSRAERLFDVEDSRRRYDDLTAEALAARGRREAMAGRRVEPSAGRRTEPPRAGDEPAPAGPGFAAPSEEESPPAPGAGEAELRPDAPVAVSETASPEPAPAPRPRPAPAPAGTGMALVTVTHDSAPELERLLASVERHLPGARVVVVDSGSRDASAALARRWSGGATVIELGENAGFARGTNAGVEAVEEEVCVLVNPDVELVDSSPAAFGEELSRPGSEAGDRILAPLVLLPDGSRQDSVHPDPASAPALITSAVPPAVLPPSLRHRAQPWRSSLPRRVGWAVGACLAARTETLRRLGPFDSRIFLYGEDLDLGLRAREAGVEIWFRPDVRVRHRRAHSSEREFGGEPFDMLARQRREVTYRRRGAGRLRLDDWSQLATFANRIALKRLAGRPAERERRQLEALRRARRDQQLG